MSTTPRRGIRRADTSTSVRVRGALKSSLRALASRRGRAVLALGLACSVGAVGTMAAWTDAAPVTGVTIKSGTMNLQVSKTAGGTFVESISDYTALSATGMFPGNSTAGLISVKNAGSGAITYTLTGAAADQGTPAGLGAQLTAKVTTATAVTGSGLSSTCGGTTLSQGPVNGSLLPAARPLAVNAVETLCIQITLNDAAPASLQNATSNLSFTFTGSTA